MKKRKKKEEKKRRRIKTTNTKQGCVDAKEICISLL
jgi:hypothetical protein